MHVLFLVLFLFPQSSVLNTSLLPSVMYFFIMNSNTGVHPEAIKHSQEHQMRIILPQKITARASVNPLMINICSETTVTSCFVEY